MRLRQALERVNGEVQQNLDDIRAVDFHAKVRGRRRGGKFVVLNGRMHAHQLFQIRHQLADARRLRFAGLVPEKTQVTARNFDAISDLPLHNTQPLADEFQVLHLETRRTVQLFC